MLHGMKVANVQSLIFSVKQLLLYAILISRRDTAGLFHVLLVTCFYAQTDDVGLCPTTRRCSRSGDTSLTDYGHLLVLVNGLGRSTLHRLTDVTSFTIRCWLLVAAMCKSLRLTWGSSKAKLKKNPCLLIPTILGILMSGLLACCCLTFAKNERGRYLMQCLFCGGTAAESLHDD